MTSISLNPPGSSIMQSQSQIFNIITSPNNQDSSSNSNSLSCRTLFNILDRTQTFEVGDQFRVKDQQDDKQIYQDGSSSNNHQQVFNPQPIMENHTNNACDHNLPLHKMEEGNSIKNGHGSSKWVPSKVRLMKKMMMRHGSSNEDKSIINNNNNNNNAPSPRVQNQGHSQRSPRSNNNNNGTTRVCSDCNTSTTPLWRSGPNGPKSLCNACGIRQRKARRAMAEAANNGLATTMDPHSTKTRVYNKENKKSRTNHFTQFKNKCKSTTTTTTTVASSSQSHHQLQGETKLEYFKDFAINLKDNSACHQQVFPRDEVAQAALLLMDLSCGFVHF